MGKKSKFSRKNRVKRRQNNIILIVCCGQTEERYFKCFNSDLGEIRVSAITSPKNPTRIVAIAERMKDEGFYRETWCVFDKDDYADFDQAIEMAEELGIKVAFSNQAFEYWYILHFYKISGQINRNRYSDILEKCLGRPYRKASDNMYNYLKDKTGTAITNAKIIHQNHRKEGGKPSVWESSTTVYKLVSELEKWKK